MVFTTSRVLEVVCSPPRIFQVLYLRRGIVVGGGPMLVEPGDPAPAVDALASGFTVTPERPSAHELGPRDRLCSGLTWDRVWATPTGYEVAVLLGAVRLLPDHALIEIPWPGAPVLIDRVPMPG